MSSLTPRRRVDRLCVEQNWRCAYCQEEFGDPDREANPTLDHVVPLSRGGSRRMDNLVAACARCNHAKGNMTAAEFCERIDKGSLRQRRDMLKLRVGRQAGRTQARELYWTLERPQRTPGPPGVQNTPHSKNKPLKRLYTADDARQWDEDRFAK